MCLTPELYSRSDVISMTHDTNGDGQLAKKLTGCSAAFSHIKSDEVVPGLPALRTEGALRQPGLSGWGCVSCRAFLCVDLQAGASAYS